MNWSAGREFHAPIIRGVPKGDKGTRKPSPKHRSTLPSRGEGRPVLDKAKAALRQGGLRGGEGGERYASSRAMAKEPRAPALCRASAMALPSHPERMAPEISRATSMMASTPRVLSEYQKR